MTAAGNVIVFRIVLLGECNKHKASNVLYIERRISQSQSTHIEKLLDQGRIGVIEIDAALREVSSEQNPPARIGRQRDAFVNGVRTLRENLRIDAQCAAP